MKDVLPGLYQFTRMLIIQQVNYFILASYINELGPDDPAGLLVVEEYQKGSGIYTDDDEDGLQGQFCLVASDCYLALNF